MLDFIKVEKTIRKSRIELSPSFVVKHSNDLMTKGHSFYAIWDEERGLWSTDEFDLIRLVDNDILDAAKGVDEIGGMKLMRDFSTNKMREWKQFCNLIPDNYKELNDKVLFSNSNVRKSDYATFTLPYPLIEQDTQNYDELMSVLYEPEERLKIEWAVGSVIAGKSKNIQKFIVLYGGPGTGKSTILNIISGVLSGYVGEFDSKAIGSSSEFALESIKENPLVAIDHEGDLSKIETNTRLNSIIAHETISVNEKHKSVYKMKFNSFLFIGSNKPVRITDAKSGILRRLIDVSPTGKKIPKSKYDKLMSAIDFEYSGIAWHCLKVFEELGPKYYDKYVPSSMMIKTNDFYNFIEDNYELFKNVDEDGLALSTVWARYKSYVQEANVPYPMSMRVFKDELKNYFADFADRYKSRYSVYFGFLENKFKPEESKKEKPDQNEIPNWLKLQSGIQSELDDVLKDCPAQYASPEGTPVVQWDNCLTKLSELITSKLHYVRPPDNLIVIDFDLKNEKGEKDYEQNQRAAASWPQTYVECSKSGAGLHLHYWYDGDVESLSRVFSDSVEVKVFSGKSSLRRKLSKCNDIPIARISSGIPLKERRDKVLNEESVKSEKSLRNLIQRNLRKEIHPGTKPSMDFIDKILKDAYESGLKYDVTDMRPAIQNFAMGSTHQADYCMRLLMRMKFKSEESTENKEHAKEAPIVFFDVEVFPNLFTICAKRQGPGNAMIKMINPKPEDVEGLTKFRLVGFNCRKYDNHILYARIMGYNNEQLYKLSKRIIDGDKNAFFGEAYNLSYTDIYDYMSSTNKASLKKWEIKLGIHHQELGLPWDQPVPEHLWPKVLEYNGYDVEATEATWDATQDDFLAREILAEWAHMTVNDTTNSLTTKIIIGNDKDPWSKYKYTNLSTIFPGYEYNQFGIDQNRYLPGAKIVSGKSIYKGKDPGEGGYAIGYPGIYHNVRVFDIASMHPHSMIKLQVFGEEYTMRLANIVEARVFIKHGYFDKAKEILPEELHHYLNNKAQAKKLSNALKTAINSVYGLTSAKFENKLRDPRNKDNIVAKYGALFMINLEEEVTKRGYKVVHIKTDSIKIADADDEITQFVMDYGAQYGFTFEWEDTYEKMCIVNDAVYIAKYAEPHKDEVTGKDVWWTATGTQFQVPYVFKTLFSHEPITFADMCETKSVTTAMYLDFNENLGEDEHDRRFVGKVGLFTPVKDGYGGGALLREGNEGRFSSVTGTKKPNGKDIYRWMEAEEFYKLRLTEDAIDRSYYNKLVDDAVDTISQYGDFEAFVADDPEWMKIPDTDAEEIPFPMNEPVAA